MRGLSLVPFVAAVCGLFATAPEARAQVGHMHAQRGGQEPILVLDHVLWWFNGRSPARYKTTGTLSVQNAVGPFSFCIALGADKVNFTGPNENVLSVGVTTVGMSDPDHPHDVVFQVVGPTGTFLATANATVYAPTTLHFVSNVDRADPTYSYLSLINYQVKDQYGTALAKDVPVNEHFDSNEAPDTAPMDWTHGDNGGFFAPNASFADHIQGQGAGSIPQAVVPTDPTAWGPVCHWTGTWNVGSVLPGLGKQVQSDFPWSGGSECIWKKYLGLARHE